VSSDLGRQYKTNIAMILATNAFMTILAKPTEGGARTLVLAALTTAAENGKYITHYQSDEAYKV
jgi:ABC-type sugar transport system ATPase subunit